MPGRTALRTIVASRAFATAFRIHPPVRLHRLLLPGVAVATLSCAAARATPPAAVGTPATFAPDTVVEETALDGCVRLHHLWKPQLAALGQRAAGQPRDARIARLVAAAYRPHAPFWAGYAGLDDEAAFVRWAEPRLRELETDPRRTIPITVEPGGMIAEATRRVAEFTGRPRACSDWYVVFGPGWTNLGGLRDLGMVVDFLGMPQDRGVEDFRAVLPHEVAHVAWDPAHRDDPDEGTLLGRIVSEGFATWFADLYWGDSLSAAQALGYTDDEWDWAVAHERELWEAAVPVLGSREREVLDRFAAVRERPLPGGPGKVGYFLGHRIVDAYVRRHGADSWRALYEMPYARILEASGYGAAPGGPAAG